MVIRIFENLISPVIWKCFVIEVAVVSTERLHHQVLQHFRKCDGMMYSKILLVSIISLRGECSVQFGLDLT
jgi:hypothetical protein